MADWDVIIVGAGITGINSAYLLQQQQPGLRYLILESRAELGGTWSYWTYPGARSDSASAVYRFRWHTWPHDTDFASAAQIQAYIVDAAHTQGIDQHICFNQRVGEARWSTAAQCWTVDVADAVTGAPLPSYRTAWVVHCSGYYSYTKAQATALPGLERFGGTVLHPQFWDSEAGVDKTDKSKADRPDHITGKRVVLVGSGATAVTMLPHLAARAAHVTLLQRSPSYVLALPRRDPLTSTLRRWLPRHMADVLDWYRHVIVEQLFVLFLTRCPWAGRRLLRALTAAQLPPDCPVDVHFAPRYPPFEQRLCMAPDGDFFQALRRPNCTIVTGVIDTVTQNGLRVRVPGSDACQDLAADTIVTATGLHVEILGNRAPIVDGRPVDISQRFVWRSCMVEGVPNSALLIGYTQGTWLPGVDARFRTVLSVLRHMRSVGATMALPAMDPDCRATMPRQPVLPNSSGYLVRARDRLPLSSGRYPWVNGLNWLYDAWNNLVGRPTDGMVYAGPGK